MHTYKISKNELFDSLIQLTTLRQPCRWAWPRNHKGIKAWIFWAGMWNRCGRRHKAKGKTISEHMFWAWLCCKCKWDWLEPTSSKNMSWTWLRWWWWKWHRIISMFWEADLRHIMCSVIAGYVNFNQHARPARSPPFFSKPFGQASFYDNNTWLTPLWRYSKSRHWCHVCSGKYCEQLSSC